MWQKGNDMPEKKLYKIYQGRVIGGVCLGLSEYFGIDVVFVRVGFFFLVLMWGAGLLLYLVMYFSMPRKPDSVL